MSEALRRSHPALLGAIAGVALGNVLLALNPHLLAPVPGPAPPRAAAASSAPSLLAPFGLLVEGARRPVARLLGSGGAPASSSSRAFAEEQRQILLLLPRQRHASAPRRRRPSRAPRPALAALLAVRARPRGRAAARVPPRPSRPPRRPSPSSGAAARTARPSRAAGDPADGDAEPPRRRPRGDLVGPPLPRRLRRDAARLRDGSSRRGRVGRSARSSRTTGRRSGRRRRPESSRESTVSSPGTAIDTPLGVLRLLPRLPGLRGADPRPVLPSLSRRAAPSGGASRSGRSSRQRKHEAAVLGWPAAEPPRDGLVLWATEAFFAGGARRGPRSRRKRRPVRGSSSSAPGTSTGRSRAPSSRRRFPRRNGGEAAAAEGAARDLGIVGATLAAVPTGPGSVSALVLSGLAGPARVWGPAAEPRRYFGSPRRDAETGRRRSSPTTGSSTTRSATSSSGRGASGRSASSPRPASARRLPLTALLDLLRGRAPTASPDAGDDGFLVLWGSGIRSGRAAHVGRRRRPGADAPRPRGRADRARHGRSRPRRGVRRALRAGDEHPRRHDVRARGPAVTAAGAARGAGGDPPRSPRPWVRPPALPLERGPSRALDRRGARRSARRGSRRRRDAPLVGTTPLQPPDAGFVNSWLTNPFAAGLLGDRPRRREAGSPPSARSRSFPSLVLLLAIVALAAQVSAGRALPFPSSSPALLVAPRPGSSSTGRWGWNAVATSALVVLAAWSPFAPAGPILLRAGPPRRAGSSALSLWGYLAAWALLPLPLRSSSPRRFDRRGQPPAARRVPSPRRASRRASSSRRPLAAPLRGPSGARPRPDARALRRARRRAPRCLPALAPERRRLREALHGRWRSEREARRPGASRSSPSRSRVSRSSRRRTAFAVRGPRVSSRRSRASCSPRASSPSRSRRTPTATVAGGALSRRPGRASEPSASSKLLGPARPEVRDGGARRSSSPSPPSPTPPASSAGSPRRASTAPSAGRRGTSPTPSPPSSHRARPGRRRSSARGAARNTFVVDALLQDPRSAAPAIRQCAGPGDPSLRPFPRRPLRRRRDRRERGLVARALGAVPVASGGVLPGRPGWTLWRIPARAGARRRRGRSSRGSRWFPRPVTGSFLVPEEGLYTFASRGATRGEARRRRRLRRLPPGRRPDGAPRAGDGTTCRCGRSFRVRRLRVTGPDGFVLPSP